MVRDMDRKELKLFDPDRERERVKTEEEDLRIRFHKADALVAHIGYFVDSRVGKTDSSLSSREIKSFGIGQAWRPAIKTIIRRRDEREKGSRQLV